MDNVIVYGAGGHAKAVIDVIEKAGQYRIMGIIDGYKQAGLHVYGYPILGNDDWLLAHRDEVYGGIVAIGDNWLRATITAAIQEAIPDFKFISAVHPSCSLARGSQIGAGSVLMAGSIVNSDTVIGEHSILNTHASVDHDCVIGSFASLAPKAATGGNVRIGGYSAIAIGATISHGRLIGEHVVIGACSTVLADIPSYTVAYGTPAKVIRSRYAGERYL